MSAACINRCPAAHDAAPNQWGEGEEGEGGGGGGCCVCGVWGGVDCGDVGGSCCELVWVGAIVVVVVVIVLLVVV